MGVYMKKDWDTLPYWIAAAVDKSNEILYNNFINLNNNLHGKQDKAIDRVCPFTLFIYTPTLYLIFHTWHYSMVCVYHWYTLEIEEIVKMVQGVSNITNDIYKNMESKFFKIRSDLATLQWTNGNCWKIISFESSINYWQ